MTHAEGLKGDSSKKTHQGDPEIDTHSYIAITRRMNIFKTYKGDLDIEKHTDDVKQT